MRKTVRFALASLTVLALAACGKSVDANQSATADTVEVPAEEAMANATALPTDMATGIASEPEADGETASDAE
jgi:hypothetical protein